MVWWMASATADMPSVEYDVATGSDCDMAPSAAVIQSAHVSSKMSKQCGPFICANFSVHAMEVAMGRGSMPRARRPRPKAS